MLTEIQGDLFEYVGKTNDKIIYIPHVVNDKNAWGAGFALALSKHYLKAEERYHRLPPVLGDLHLIPCRNHGFSNLDRNVIIANMCAQTLGGNRPLFYNKLVNCMDRLAGFVCDDFNRENIEIVCPRFGSSLAGGNWEFIKELIHDCWVRRGITVKVFYL